MYTAVKESVVAVKESVVDFGTRAAQARIKARSDVEATIVTRAMNDEAFRAELVANPRAVLEKEIGRILGKKVELPKDFTVTVVEETVNSAAIVLPARVPTLVRNAGPSEAELDPNGGLAFYCTTITCKPGFSC